jgi:hypothetical protein
MLYRHQAHLRVFLNSQFLIMLDLALFEKKEGENLTILSLLNSCIIDVLIGAISAKSDWDAYERSWDFARLPIYPYHTTQTTQPCRQLHRHPRTLATHDQRNATARTRKQPHLYRRLRPTRRTHPRRTPQRNHPHLQPPLPLWWRQHPRTTRTTPTIRHRSRTHLLRHRQHDGTLQPQRNRTHLRPRQQHRLRPHPLHHLPRRRRRHPPRHRHALVCRRCRQPRPRIPLSRMGSNHQQSKAKPATPWLADSLGRKSEETPEEAIRRYIATSFYKDHLQTYKKRPIYWLFSSGKHKAFEALVYLHRYNEGTLSRMRTEYVVPLTGKMNDRIRFLETEVPKATSTAERKKLEKDIERLKKKLDELRLYDEKLRHYADRRIALDLDDGVKVNYGKFGDLLAEVKAITGGSDE